MKNGTAYAAKLRRAYAKLRPAERASEETPELDDPLRRMAIAILSVGCHEEDGKRALDRALTTMVDWNDIRVSSARELSKAIGNSIPDGITRCQSLIDALRSIYDNENDISLERLKSLGRREAKQYLENLDGVDEYATASVLLWSLGGHAVPVNDSLFAELREAGLVHPEATRAEVQAFLERHVAASEARQFCALIKTLPRANPRASRQTTVNKTARKTTLKTKRAAKSKP